MSVKPIVNIRMSQETKKLGEEQAEKLGLNLSEYINFLINLEAASGIIERLKESK